MNSEKELKRHLTELTRAVTVFLVALDGEMKQPGTPDRGKRIARLCNELEMANDRAKHFGLGIAYRTDTKAKG